MLKKIINPNTGQNDKRIVVIVFFLLIILVVIGAFYWYEYRPSQIRKECTAEAERDARDIIRKKARISDNDFYNEVKREDLFLSKDYDTAFKRCLQSRGLD